MASIVAVQRDETAKFDVQHHEEYIEKRAVEISRATCNEEFRLSQPVARIADVLEQP